MYIACSYLSITKRNSSRSLSYFFIFYIDLFLSKYFESKFSMKSVFFYHKTLNNFILINTENQ